MRFIRAKRKILNPVKYPVYFCFHIIYRIPEFWQNIVYPAIKTPCIRIRYLFASWLYPWLSRYLLYVVSMVDFNYPVQLSKIFRIVLPVRVVVFEKQRLCNIFFHGLFLYYRDVSASRILFTPRFRQNKKDDGR